MICSECGMENSDESNFCETCGNKSKKDELSIKNSHLLNWKAIIIGSVIGTVVGIVFMVSRLSFGVFSFPFFIGIISGYIAGGGWKKGAIHATIANSIFVILSMVIFSILLFSGVGKSPIPELSIAFFSVILILIGVVVLIYCLFFGVLGGMLGAYIKEKLIKRSSAL